MRPNYGLTDVEFLCWSLEFFFCIVCKLVLKSSMTTCMASTMAIHLILRGSQLMYPHAHQLPRSFKVRIPKLILAPAINPCRGTWVLAILRLLPSIIEVTKLTHNPRTTKVKPPMFTFPGFFGRLHQMPICADIKTLNGMLGLYNWSLITAFLVSHRFNFPVLFKLVLSYTSGRRNL